MSLSGSDPDMQMVPVIADARCVGCEDDLVRPYVEKATGFHVALGCRFIDACSDEREVAELSKSGAVSWDVRRHAAPVVRHVPSDGEPRVVGAGSDGER